MGSARKTGGEIIITQHVNGGNRGTDGSALIFSLDITLHKYIITSWFYF